MGWVGAEPTYERSSYIYNLNILNDWPHAIVSHSHDRGRFPAEWKGSNNTMSQRDSSSSPSWSQTQHLCSPTPTMTGEFHSPMQWCLFSLYLPQLPMFPVCLRGRSVSGRSASSCRMHSSRIKPSKAPALDFMLFYALAHGQRELLDCSYFPSFYGWKWLCALWSLNNSSHTPPRRYLLV